MSDCHRTVREYGFVDTPIDDTPIDVRQTYIIR